METHAHSRTSEARISVKIDRAFKDQIIEVERVTGLNEATLTRRLWEALIEHVRDNGHVTLPLRVTSRPELELAFEDALPNDYLSLENEQKNVVISRIMRGRFTRRKPRSKE